MPKKIKFRDENDKSPKLKWGERERERERERQNTQNPPSDFPHKTRKFDEILNVTLNILYYIVL